MYSDTITAPHRKVGSSFAIVESSLAIIPVKKHRWEKSQRIPAISRGGIMAARAAKEDLLAEIKSGGGVIPNFLVCKKKGNRYYPINGSAHLERKVSRGFGSFDSLRTFARSIGKNRIRCGAIVTAA